LEYLCITCGSLHRNPSVRFPIQNRHPHHAVCWNWFASPLHLSSNSLLLQWHLITMLENPTFRLMSMLNNDQQMTSMKTSLFTSTYLINHVFGVVPHCMMETNKNQYSSSKPQKSTAFKKTHSETRHSNKVGNWNEKWNLLTWPSSPDIHFPLMTSGKRFARISILMKIWYWNTFFYKPHIVK
jgi:hypothetical protein